jgi:hypothetical protein
VEDVVHGWITRLVQQRPEKIYGPVFNAEAEMVVVVSESGASRIKENIGIVGIVKNTI